MQAQTPALPPVAELPPLPGLAQTSTGATVVIPGVSPGPNEVYQAFRAQRRVLGEQLSQAENTRFNIAQRLREGKVTGADRAGLEARLTELDGRMSSLGKQIEVADAQVAKAASVPGAVENSSPFVDRGGPPQEVFFLAGLFIMVVMLPLSIAISRRIWRRGAAPQQAAHMSREMDERFSRLEQAMDAVAVEVERVGESQRFVAKVLSEEGSPRALGVGAAEPIAIRAREGQEVRR